METSIFIAKILGLVYLAVGLGMIFSPGYYREKFEEMVKNASFMYLGGLLALVVGFLVITYHNIWENSWVVLVTIIGWLALLKGLLLLIFPRTMINLCMPLVKKDSCLIAKGIIVLILGLIFGYFGFL